MKILAIYGQSHKKNTYKVTQMLLSKLNCSKEDIIEMNINGMPQCIGCNQCILKGEEYCPHYDSIAPIISAIDEAQVIILATPTYCMGMSGQLKSFCDHMAYRWVVHRPNDMRKKTGIVISTAAGAGASKVTKQLAEQLIWWTVGKTYEIPFVVKAPSFKDIPSPRISKLNNRINLIAERVNKTNGIMKPCLKTQALFKIMAIVHKKNCFVPLEFDYWKEHGWI